MAGGLRDRACGSASNDLGRTYAITPAFLYFRRFHALACVYEKNVVHLFYIGNSSGGWPVSAAVAVMTPSVVQKFDTWLCGVRSRYASLVSAAGTPERRADVARLGAKIAELQAIVHDRCLSERDAATLPRLAGWLDSQLEEFERTPAAELLPIPVATAHDPLRQAALERILATFESVFGYAPGYVALLRLDALLRIYPREAVAGALARCSRRHGRVLWDAIVAELRVGDHPHILECSA
jgi:hypothetical protein